MAKRALTIAYCGPIAVAGQPARGGFEAANRRLIDDLRRSGLDVVELPYAQEQKRRWQKLLAYGAGFARLAARTLFGAGRWDVFHITPLRGQFMLAELVVCELVRWRGAKLVVDLRAGAIGDDLGQARPLRRAALEHLLRRSALVCVEGEAYIPLVAPYHHDILYLPNYVAAATLTERSSQPQGPVNLLFLGRVVPEKGIEIVLDCLRTLTERGIAATLKVIGRGDDDYVAGLKAEAADLPVDWLGAVPHPEVPSHLRDSHFFVFPTRHRGEGHSNALTEAMSQGVVPLVADNGFNRQVIGDAGVVLERYASGHDYANAIEFMLSTGAWLSHSRRASDRIRDQFTDEALVDQLVARYCGLDDEACPHRSRAARMPGKPFGSNLSSASTD